MQALITLLKKHTKLKDIQLEVPPSLDLGNYSFPCFNLAKKLKKSPAEIATDLAQKIILPKEIEKVQANGPYLNFFLNKSLQAQNTLKIILKTKGKYGSKNLGKKQRVMIEFSQPNTHKAFHIGHLRGTSLGESLSRLYEFTNHEVLRTNYMGDTGAHVAKWLWYYTKYLNKPLPKKERERWIADIYVKAVKKINENPELQAEVDIINKKIESRNNSILPLWKKTKIWSLNAFKEIYKELNTKFDYYFFESQMESSGKIIAKQLLKKKIAKIDEGATLIDLEKDNLGKWILLRQDGTCLYSIKDMALAKLKFEKYKIKKNIYVVGAAQSLHLKQLFKTLELLKYPQAKLCYHLSFTEVRFPTGKMSSRTGENVLYLDLKKDLLKKATQETKKRNPSWNKSKLEKISKEVILSAIKYSMLSQDPNKNIIFDPKKELSFEGDTGPYLLYTYARANSILKKSKLSETAIDFSLLKEPAEVELITKLESFPDLIEKATLSSQPTLLANYTHELTQLFNEFYHKYPVLKAEKQLKTSRLTLVKAVKQVLKLSLELLGITPLDQM